MSSFRTIFLYTADDRLDHRCNTGDDLLPFILFADLYHFSKSIHVGDTHRDS
ncbi:hypothetical protein MTR_5g078835 [Medicago truncatula]|uniref:Uncharacterized protein n=1 Tax=Medicago truncatula TaxID=3880 RepID=A0A072UEP5_MEDTR|nr:hypothetical protein MTR_5g078835 [Medicago truncatula]